MKSDRQSSKIKRARGFLARLAANKSGNTLAIMTASIVPLAGVLGGGLDAGRAYLAKSRLQAACDAGALAGRKSLSGTTWTPTADDAANSYFNLNFLDGQYGTTNLTKTFTSADGQTVSGQATVKVPTTLMKIFGKDNIPVSVTCQGVVNMPNTDIMFVLDTTGSMNNKNPGDPDPRIVGLRSAVKNFYNQVELAKGSSTAQARYGFVPYAQTVNVGNALKPEWIADRWSYQSRKPDGTVPSGDGGPPDYLWEYDQIEYDTSSLVVGGSITANIGPEHTPLTAGWNGCIEERKTILDSDYDPVPDSAYDLQIDLVPNGDSDTQWGPYLPGLLWARDSVDDWNRTKHNKWIDNGQDYGSTLAYLANCPSPARKLSAISPGDLDSYLTALVPSGNTYHDIGLVWGARFLSPTGLFASENATAPNGNDISRHIIFMTDGQTNTRIQDYDAYGLNAIDRRRKGNPNDLPTDAENNAEVELRFSAMCTEIKRRKMTIWVIAFGTSLTTMLEDCANSTNHAFQASDTSGLNDAFTSIAAQISNLRLSN